MNATEFDQLIANHVRRFDGLRGRLDKPLLEDWFDVLKPFPADDVEAASRRMFSDEDCRPRGYSEHPSRLRQLAVQLAAERNRDNAKESRRTRYVDGEPVFDCPHCEDMGRVEVVDPDWVQLYRAGKVQTVECDARRKELAGDKADWCWTLDPRPVTFSMRCSCRGGAYKPERFYAATSVMLAARLGEFESWLKEWKHPRRNAGLDRWNETGVA